MAIFSLDLGTALIVKLIFVSFRGGWFVIQAERDTE